MILSTTIQTLNLSSNGLTGELPLLTGNLAVLDLSNNRFGGNLTKIAKWGNLEYVDLSQNLLKGSIPEITPQFLRLNYLNLSHNSLTSSLPKAIARYPKLRVLDLSSNHLDGPFLTDLLSTPTLQELYLADNLFTGAIEFSPPTASSIQVLDLSHNQINGSLPDRLGSLTRLQVLYLAANNISGSLPTSLSNLTTLSSLDISQNNFSGPLPGNLPGTIQTFNVSYNDFDGVVPENLRKFPSSSFYPGNSKLSFPGGPPGTSAKNSNRKPINTAVKVIVIVSCVIAVIILILLAIFIHYIRISRRLQRDNASDKEIQQRRTLANPSGATITGGGGGALVVSAEDLVTSKRGASTGITSPDKKMAVVKGLSPSKNSGQLSWSSPGSSDSYTAENLSRLDVRSPDQLVGELHFLDDTITLTPEELSRAPAEVLGRSSHGTSYKATLENGLLLTVKWLREGVAKQRKEFAKEAKKFANIRHPNVVGLRGYYWGPTQHEKLILSDYISPGSLSSFLYGNFFLS